MFVSLIHDENTSEVILNRPIFHFHYAAQRIIDDRDIWICAKTLPGPLYTVHGKRKNSKSEKLHNDTCYQFLSFMLLGLLRPP